VSGGENNAAMNQRIAGALTPLLKVTHQMALVRSMVNRLMAAFLHLDRISAVFTES